MGGLISFLLYKIKKHKPRNIFIRCFSKRPSGTKTRRGYRKLVGQGSQEGLSLRRTGSHSQPPVTTDVAALELAHSSSLRMNSVDPSRLSYFTYGSRRAHSGTYEVSKKTCNGGVSRRRRQSRA